MMRNRQICQNVNKITFLSYLKGDKLLGGRGCVIGILMYFMIYDFV